MIFEEVINPSISSELFFFSVPETLEPSADTTRRKEREERNKQAIHAYNEELQRKKAKDNAKINGLQIGDFEKKALYLALGKESQKCVGHKYPGKKT